jgi:hypothetical protein
MGPVIPLDPSLISPRHRLGRLHRREAAAYRELQFARRELAGAKALGLDPEIVFERLEAVNAAEEGWSLAHGDVDIEEERGR